MKKITSLVLLVCLTLTLSACGGTKETIAKGVISGDSYTSETTGFTFTLPEGWEFASDEYLAELMGESIDILYEGDNFSKKLLEAQIIYEMLAQNPETGTNVIILFENLSLVKDGTKMTASEYIDYSIGLLEDSNILPYQFGDIQDAKLGGADYKMVEMDVPDYGLTQYSYARKVDKYMVSITITVVGDAALDDVVSNFS